MRMLAGVFIYKTLHLCAVAWPWSMCVCVGGGCGCVGGCACVGVWVCVCEHPFGIVNRCTYDSGCRILWRAMWKFKARYLWRTQPTKQHQLYTNVRISSKTRAPILFNSKRPKTWVMQWFDEQVFLCPFSRFRTDGVVAFARPLSLLRQVIFGREKNEYLQTYDVLFKYNVFIKMFVRSQNSTWNEILQCIPFQLAPHACANSVAFKFIYIRFENKSKSSKCNLLNLAFSFTM